MAPASAVADCHTRSLEPRKQVSSTDKPPARVAKFHEAFLVFGVTDPPDIAVGAEEAKCAVLDGAPGGEVLELDVFAPGRDGTVAVQLPVERRQRGVVILLL